jgi:hypothetical protein
MANNSRALRHLMRGFNEARSVGIGFAISLFLSSLKNYRLTTLKKYRSISSGSPVGLTDESVRM